MQSIKRASPCTSAPYSHFRWASLLPFLLGIGIVYESGQGNAFAQPPTQNGQYDTTPPQPTAQIPPPSLVRQPAYSVPSHPHAVGDDGRASQIPPQQSAPPKMPSRLGGGMPTIDQSNMRQEYPNTPVTQAASFTARGNSAPDERLPSLSGMGSGGELQLSPQTRSSTLQLKARSSNGEGELQRPASSIGSFLSIVFSLGIVLSLFFAVAMLYRKAQPAVSNQRLSSEVVQVLGRSALSPRQSVYVVRFGKKLLLVSQQPGQTETLSEIDDITEVERLTKLCGNEAVPSSSVNFSNILKQLTSNK